MILADFQHRIENAAIPLTRGMPGCKEAYAWSEDEQPDEFGSDWDEPSEDDSDSWLEEPWDDEEAQPESGDFWWEQEEQEW